MNLLIHIWVRSLRYFEISTINSRLHLLKQQGMIWIFGTRLTSCTWIVIFQWSPGCSGLTTMILRLGERLQTVTQPLLQISSTRGHCFFCSSCWASHRLSFSVLMKTEVFWTETGSIILFGRAETSCDTTASQPAVVLLELERSTGPDTR
jgi:hypothetical protein